MKRGVFLKFDLYRVSVLAVAVLLMLCWASVAQAQQGGPPSDQQYGNPASAVGPTVGEGTSEAADCSAAGSSEATGASAASTSAAGSSEAGGTSECGEGEIASGGSAATAASGSGASGSAGGVLSVLPDTGGPQIYLLILAGGALLGAGMLVRRSVRR